MRGGMTVIGALAAAAVVAGCALPADEAATLGAASDAVCADFCVTSVDHDPARFRTRVEFRVHGQDLPSSLAFWVDQCRDVRRGPNDGKTARFSCIPDHSVGTKVGIVRQSPRARLGFDFTVDVYEPR
jgi:hypothetical protein